MDSHVTLVCIARRLTFEALLKFAQVNDATNRAAREAWETWRSACTAFRFGRMLSDKSWMDTYSRNIRQLVFRNVDASKAWIKHEPVPIWLQAALQYNLNDSNVSWPAVYQKRDGSVVNIRIYKNKEPWMFISSTAHYVHLSENMAPMDTHIRQQVIKMLQASRVIFSRRKKTTQLPQELKVPVTDSSLVRDDTSFHHLSSSV